MMSSRKASVITVTARARRFQRTRSTVFISGQVATTIIAAQISAGRKGRRIQKLPPIIIPITSTMSTMRVMS